MDLQSGRDLLGSVQSREKVKKQKIGIDRKVFTLECQVKDLQRELGIKKHPQKVVHATINIFKFKEILFIMIE